MGGPPGCGNPEPPDGTPAFPWGRAYYGGPQGPGCPYGIPTSDAGRKFTNETAGCRFESYRPGTSVQI